tara:strand:+ start:459 stop:2663 length:2205 start_codon:yes stop_codon:yes gene_type:complete
MTQTVVPIPASEGGGGSFDPKDVEITDNTSGAFLIKEGSNEYMRVDTTNGSEKMVLKGRPGSAANAQLFLHDQPFLQGSRSNFIQMSSPGVSIQSGSNGAQINNVISNVGNNFRILGTSNLVNFLMMDDSNATFTLDASNSALFKIQDDAGSPHEFFRVDTTASARDIRLKTGAANQIFTMQEGSGTGKFFQIRNGAYNQIYMQDDNLFGILAERLTHTMYAGGFHKVVDASSAELFKIDETSDTAFTVKADQGAGFTVNLPGDGAGGNPNTGFQILPTAGHLKFGRQAAGIYSGGTGFDLNVGGGKSFIFNGGQVRMRTSSTPIEFNLNDASGGSVKITDAADNDILKVEQNSNFTHTLDQSETGIFKVSSDGSGTPDLFKITSGPTASDERIRIQFTPADRFVELDEGSFNFGCQNATLALVNGGNFNGLIHGNYNFDTYAGGTSFRYHDTSNSKTVMQVNRTGAAFFNLRTNGETFKVKKDTTDVLSIDATSAATYTLEDASSAVFKIVDDNSSPKTYLSITQNAGCVFGEVTGQTTIEGSNIGTGNAGVHIKGGTIVLKNYNSQQLLTIFNGDEIVYNAGAALKNFSYFGDEVDTTSSGTTSIVGQELKINTTFRYDPTNALTNDGVITVKFECDKAFYSDGTSPAERMVTFHNKNTTHDATYILLPNTSHGTLNSALGTTDAKAAAIANSGGLTLKPGEYIILRLITFNPTGSTSDARHTISTIGHNIP